MGKAIQTCCGQIWIRRLMLRCPNTFGIILVMVREICTREDLVLFLILVSEAEGDSEEEIGVELTSIGNASLRLYVILSSSIVAFITLNFKNRICRIQHASHSAPDSRSRKSICPKMLVFPPAGFRSTRSRIRQGPNLFGIPL